MRSGVVTWRLGTEIPPVTGEPRPSALARLSPPPGRWRRPIFWLSAAVHALIVLALLFEVPRKPPNNDGLGPPSVSVILGPSAETPTSPAPTPEAALGLPNAPTVERSPAPEASTAPPAAPDAVPPPPSPPAPETPPSVAALQPAPQAPPPTPAPPAPPRTPSVIEDATAPPSPLPLLPTPPIPPAETPAPPRAPAPPVREALIQPQIARPPAPPAPVHPAAPAPPRPPRPFVPQRPPAQRPADPNAFPTPMFSSLGGAFSRSATRPAAPSREMPGPVKDAASSAYRPQYDLSGDDLGSGWERLFADWVNRHKYYPDQAAANGEEGTVAVRITVDRNGRVSSVSLLERSGSQWLDAALEALFRGQNLPPLPADFNEAEATLNVQMHYVLIHGSR
jgi:TonB family protein